MQIHHGLLDTPLGATPTANAFYYGTAAVGALWLAWSGFQGWRRREANLTPVAANGGGDVQTPDFLKVDKAGREAALARGEAFDAKLAAREAAAAVSAESSPACRTTGLIATLMSTITLASMIFGSAMQVRWMGHYAEELTAKGRMASIVREHPVAFGVATAVVLVKVAHFFFQRRNRA